MFRNALIVTAIVVLAASASAQTGPATSLAAETDVLAYGISGYSGILSVTLPSKLQVAFGVGAYDAPSFVVNGDAHYDQAQWEARVTSLQVARATYRFRGAMRSGPAIGAVMLNQNWRLRSAPLGGDTRFRTFSVGGGTTSHRQHLPYPTAAFTHNGVSGSTSISGTSYEVERFSPKRRCTPGGSGAAAEALAARNSVGAAPVQRRKARVNALGSENPRRKATSVADVPGRERCSIARPLRTSSTSCRNDVCSSAEAALNRALAHRQLARLLRQAAARRP